MNSFWKTIAAVAAAGALIIGGTATVLAAPATPRQRDTLDTHATCVAGETTCTNVPPQDGTGNRYGRADDNRGAEARATCISGETTCTNVPPQDGTGNQYGRADGSRGAEARCANVSSQQRRGKGQ